MSDVIPSSVQKMLPVLRTENPAEEPAVRWEAASPAGDRVDLSAVARRYRENRSLIDSMLDPTVTPGQTHDLERDLGVLPTPLLQAARRNGVHIYVAKDDTAPLPVTLFRPARDSDSIRRDFEGWLADSPHVTDPPGCYLAQASADQEVHPGETLEDVARRHGAETTAEVRDYATLAGHLNARMGTYLEPETPLYDGQRVVLPDYQYRQGIRLDACAREEIKQTQEGCPVADGIYSPRSRLIVLKAGVLPDPSPTEGGERVALHEFGHAAEALLLQDPTRGPEHRRQMQAIHADDLEPITQYARTNPVEHYAEAFEAYWTAERSDPDHQADPHDGNYVDLFVYEPRLFDLMDTEMQAWEKGEVRPQRQR